MNPAPIGGPGDNTRLTVPIVTGGISDATAGETTSRIPVFDASGRAVAPGEESLRALEEEQARIAEVSAIPPSFTPKDVPDDEVDSKLPDEHLFGKLSTKVVAIIVALILVVAAAVWAVHAFRPPETILPMLPATPVKVTGLISMLTLCHLVAARTRRTVAPLTILQNRVMPLRANPRTRHQTSPRSPRLLIRRPRRPRPRSPAIRIPALFRNRAMRTTRRLRFPAPTSCRILAANPGTHTTCTLTSRRDAYRMVITIRTSGGKGYIRANTTGDPTQGKQVAEFTFAEGGTTEVKFTKAVKTQDLLLWVPSDSLPQNQLYIEKVEVF